jgi:hypothetical protein
MVDNELQELQNERKKIEAQLDEASKIRLEQEKIASLKKQLKLSNPPAYYKFASAFVDLETRAAKKLEQIAKSLIQKEIEKIKKSRAEREVKKVV